MCSVLRAKKRILPLSTEQSKEGYERATEEEKEVET
jgi:hypothetical protein